MPDRLQVHTFHIQLRSDQWMVSGWISNPACSLLQILQLSLQALSSMSLNNETGFFVLISCRFEIQAMSTILQSN